MLCPFQKTVPAALRFQPKQGFETTVHRKSREFPRQNLRKIAQRSHGKKTRGRKMLFRFPYHQTSFFQQAAAVLAQRVDLQGDFQARGFQVAGGGGGVRPRAAWGDL